jgi:hypothetical protein
MSDDRYRSGLGGADNNRSVLWELPLALPPAASPRRTGASVGSDPRTPTTRKLGVPAREGDSGGANSGPVSTPSSIASAN